MKRPFPTLDQSDVEQLFRKNYRAPERMDRDRQFERYLILRSKVELALLKRLGTEDKSHWPSEKVRFPEEIESMMVTLALGDHRKRPTGHPPRCPLSGSDGCPGERLPEKCVMKLDQDCWRFLIFVGKDGCLSPQRIVVGYERVRVVRDLPPSTSGGIPFSGLKNVAMEERGDPIYQTDTGWQRQGQVVEQEGSVLRRSGSLGEDLYQLWRRAIEVARGPSAMPCHFQCLEELGPLASRIEQSGTVAPVGSTLLHLWCLLHGYTSERKAVDYLANWFGIEDGTFSPVGWYDGRSNWHQHEEMCDLGGAELQDIVQSGCRFPSIINDRGSRSEVIQCDSAHRVILPITAWTKESIRIRHYLNVPPLSPGLANRPSIREHRYVPVILTDSIEIMMENQNGWRDNNDEPLAVWSSWYGEKEAVEHVDWTCLERRTIYYLIAPDPHLAADEARHLALGTAHAVREKLEGLKKTRLFFVELPHRRLDDAGTEGILAEACFWPLEQFSAIYRDHMALREASTPVKGFSPRSMAQITAAGVEARDFLLEPLLAERSTTLIYAKTNLGKTWLALCMATAIAHRASLFGRWRAKKARKVLYIDSEMDEQSMNERVRIVAKMLYDGKRLSPRYARNFLAISRSRAERGIELFKKHVVEYVKEKEVALVVLDNLTAFTQHNDSAKAWEETHAWIDVLKKAGCAVVIIHHENKQGGQRGTSATTNAVDNVLHLVDPNDRKEKEKKGGSEPIELDRDGLLMKVTVEKGREIFGEARKAFIVNIVPNAFPPTCSAEGLPRDDKDYEPETDSSSPAPAMSAKRPYRPKNSDERGELIDKVTEKLKAGSSVAEAARDLGISVSWIYRTEELTSRLELRDARKRRAVSRARRDERILRLHREGKLVREIQGRAGASETTVRRVIDDYWITEMRESLPGFEEHGLEWTASRVASQLEGIEESHVQRLLERLRLEKAAKEVGSGKSADQIADELELPLEQVQALSEREEAKIQAKEDRRRAREQELSKIRALHTNGEKRDTIISQVGLPRHTIVTEYNRLTKQKSKQQQQADGPVVSTETTMDDERPRDPGSHDDAAG